MQRENPRSVRNSTGHRPRLATVEAAGRVGARWRARRDPSTAPRRELRRAGAAADRALHGRVREIRVRIDGAEEETPSAHVAAADEVGGKEQPFVKDADERVDVLGTCDAAEEHHLAVGPDGLGEGTGVSLEGAPEGRFVGVDIGLREALEVLEADAGFDGHEPTPAG
jgi:hypothetical protein